MIKTFCDVCHSQMEASATLYEGGDSAFPVTGNGGGAIPIQVKLQIGINGTWYQGSCCANCVKAIVLQVALTPSRA